MRTIDGKPEYRNGLVSERGLGGLRHLGVPINLGGAPLSILGGVPFHAGGFTPCWGCSPSLEAGGEIQVILRRCL